MSFPGWYAVWLLIQLAVTSPGIGLWLSPYWQPIPRSERIGPAFGFLNLAWIATLSFFIKLIGILDAHGISTSAMMPVLVIIMAAIALGILYNMLARPMRHRASDLFP